jgi:asparagine synthase (glutamine-hydrolysing)
MIEAAGMQPEPYNFVPKQALVKSHRDPAAHSRIILTGHGADSALHGTRDHFFNLLRSGRLIRFVRDSANFYKQFRKLPNFGLRWRLLGQAPPINTFPPWLNPEFSARLDLPGRWRQLSKVPRPVHRTRPDAYRYLADFIGWGVLFEMMDAGVTGVPVTMFHPLFDLRLVTFLLSLPPFPWCVGKEILRRGTVGIVPEEIRARRKTFFPGDPNLFAIRQLDPAKLPRYTLPKELDAFIQRSAVIPLKRLQTERAVELPWVHYRPYSFAYWIRQQGSLLSKLEG